MPTHRAIDDYPVPVEYGEWILAGAVEVLGWKLVSDKERGGYSVKHLSWHMIKGPTLFVRVIENEAGCRFEYTASTFGIGPIVKRNLRELVEALRQRIFQTMGANLRLEADAATLQSSTPQKSSSATLRELADMRDAGLITEDEFARKREEIIDRL